MKITRCILYALLLFPFFSPGQEKREDIYTDVVLFPNREAFKKDLYERVIGKTFTTPLDSNTEYKYLSACWAVSQFLFYNDSVQKGFDTLFSHYSNLEYDTKKSFLEALYGTSPGGYTEQVQQILDRETDPTLFSICAVYLFRVNGSIDHGNDLKIKMTEKFPGYDSIAVLQELQKYIDDHPSQVIHSTPPIVQLFKQQRSIGQKIIYSFQRWNRDYPGLALIQNADGTFAKDAQGKLLLFEQLARSGSGLPYFIRNGNTPQGVYSIQGLDVSHDHLIGPTPNIQLLMPFEGSWDRFFHQPGVDKVDSIMMYRLLLPGEWQNYLPMMEAWYAGKIGRTEIIAHGTTIDPEYFKDRPFYPLTPTLGCLCAKELWNPTSGRLLASEQFSLVAAFQSSPGNKGYLYVINVDNQQKPLTRQEVESWVNKFESEQ